MSDSVIRTVRNGSVRIGKRVFRPREYYEARDGLPCDYPYSGQLEGQRIWFGRYKVGDTYREFVYMGGTEEQYHNPELYDTQPRPGCIDGTFFWMWWETEDEWQTTRANWRAVDDAMSGKATP